MTSDRPHRKKMPHEMALKEILRNSLTQFDPEVVRAFVRCEERGSDQRDAGRRVEDSHYGVWSAQRGLGVHNGGGPGRADERSNSSSTTTESVVSWPCLAAPGGS